MPLKLVPPKEGRSPNYYVRGTYLRVQLDRSTGTGNRAVAKKLLNKWKDEIERGAYSPPADPPAPTFASAAVAYMKAGREARFLRPIIHHFGDKPLVEIDQTAIDACAEAIYPSASAATRNRQVYTPVAAVLHYAGVELEIRRPKGAQGQAMTGWLWPEKASALIEECDKLDAEFGILCSVLLYTGMRLSEGLSLRVELLRIDEAFAYLEDSKNGDPRAIFLTPYLVDRLQAHPRGLERPKEKLFKFHKGGHLYSLLRAAAAKAEVELPQRQAFHIFCHTYATWMRRYGGLDQRGLVATGRWRDIKSTVRYTHAVVTEEAQRAALLPVPQAKLA